MDFSSNFFRVLTFFFGKFITDRIRLIISDGATTEYIPILKSIGKNGVYPNGCHGLCYFHLVIQGWNKHIKPYVTSDIA